MKLIIFAFILSLTIHILLFAPLTKKNELKEDKPSSSKIINKSKINYVRLEPKLAPKKTIEKKIIKKEIVIAKKNIYKKVKIENIRKKKKKRVIKKPKTTTPKPSKRVEVRPTFTKNVPIKPTKKRQTIKKKSLENFFLAQPEPLDKELLDEITRSYINLYGKEYNSFTKVQKVYLQKNLKNIGKITQKYLRYPSLAIKTQQQGMNIVEFNLHPNGDISKLKLSYSSKFASLDKNTIHTIEIAYKDYPRPKTITKVKIYVYYKLY